MCRSEHDNEAVKTEVMIAKKTCPECSIESDERTLVCGCGHLFLEELNAQGSDELQTLQSRSRRIKLKKFAVLGGCLIFAVGAVLYWSGWAGSASKNLSAEEPAPPAVAAQAPPAQNLISPVASKEQQPNVQYIVTTVLTGDMINVLGSDNQQVQVRIFGIVTPKLDQNFGKEARDHLSRQLLGKTVSLILKRTTKDGVLFAEVLKDGVNIGVEQVRSGLAQVAGDEMLQKDPQTLSSYSNAEFIARSGRFGIWSDAAAGSGGQVPGGEYAVTPTVSSRSNPGSSRSRPSDMRSIFDPRFGSTGDGSEGPAVILEARPANDLQTSRDDQPPETKVEVPTSEKKAEDVAISKPHPPQATVTRDRKYQKGPRGGCFYQSPGGNRVYVDRTLCN